MCLNDSVIGGVIGHRANSANKHVEIVEQCAVQCSCSPKRPHPSPILGSHQSHPSPHSWFPHSVVDFASVVFFLIRATSDVRSSVRAIKSASIHPGFFHCSGLIYKQSAVKKERSSTGVAPLVQVATLCLLLL